MSRKAGSFHSWGALNCSGRTPVPRPRVRSPISESRPSHSPILLPLRRAVIEPSREGNASSRACGANLRARNGNSSARNASSRERNASSRARNARPRVCNARRRVCNASSPAGKENSLAGRHNSRAREEKPRVSRRPSRGGSSRKRIAGRVAPPPSRPDPPLPKQTRRLRSDLA